MQLRPDQWQDIRETITKTAPEGIDYGSICVEMDINNGAICRVVVKTERVVKK